MAAIYAHLICSLDSKRDWVVHVQSLQSEQWWTTLQGSTINLCALDMSKAFDKVNHFALFNKLMDRQVPREVLTTLITWYSLSAAFVRWDNIFSDMITLTCGVRQGGVLSPVLFAVYVNDLIEKLSRSGHGCRIGETYLGCVMYADDLILMSAPCVISNLWLTFALLS